MRFAGAKQTRRATRHKNATNKLPKAVFSRVSPVYFLSAVSVYFSVEFRCIFNVFSVEFFSVITVYFQCKIRVWETDLVPSGS